MNRLFFRITLPLICCVCLAHVPRAEAQEPGPSGPQAAGIFAILIGVPVAAGYGIYYAAHAPHSIQGCIADQGGNLVLTDANSKQYFLAGKTTTVKAGERLRLSGKSRRDHSRRRLFQVKKVARDYGLCSAATPAP